MENARKTRATRLAAVLVAAMALAIAAASPAAAQPVLGGFQGSWTVIDCSSDGGCEVWGDGSTITMQIGTGKNPKIAIKDSYSSACADAGVSSTRWAASGTGWYTQEPATDGGPGPIMLHVTLSKAGCGTYATLGDLGRDIWWDPNPLVLDFYHDLGSDTIWFDPDGINGGLNFERAN